MKSKDVAVAKRSGRMPGVIAAIASGVAIGYDEKHWHVLHHIFGGISWVFAILLIVAIFWSTTRLISRPAGQITMTMTTREEGDE